MEKFSSIDWIKIDIANAFGMDKILFEERLNWFEENQNKLDPKTADEPCRAYAGLKALKQALRGEPIGFIVGLDATSSFAQMQGILLADRKACVLSNVIFEGKRADIYTKLYKKLLEKVPNCPDNITRSDIKKVIMQFFYGGSATPKKILGKEIFEKFMLVMQEELPLCYGLRQYMLSHWLPTVDEYSWILPDNFHVIVPVECKYKQDFNFKGEDYTFYFSKKAPTKEGRSLGPNFIHSWDGFILREMVARCHFNQEKIDALRKVQYSQSKVKNLTIKTLKDSKTVETLLNLGKESGYYSVRLLDFITPETIGDIPSTVLDQILGTLPKKSFDISTIHDCYFCHPNYVNDMKEQYRQCLIQLSKSNALQYSLRQIFKDNSFKYIKPLDLTEEISKEEYAIC